MDGTREVLLHSRGLKRSNCCEPWSCADRRKKHVGRNRCFRSHTLRQVARDAPTAHFAQGSPISKSKRTNKAKTPYCDYHLYCVAGGAPGCAPGCASGCAPGCAPGPANGMEFKTETADRNHKTSEPVPHYSSKMEMSFDTMC